MWGFVGDRTSEAEYVHEDEEGGFWEGAVSVPSSSLGWINWAIVCTLFGSALDITVILLWTNLISDILPLGIVQQIDASMSRHGANIANWFFNVDPDSVKRGRRGGAFVLIIAILAATGHLAAWVRLVVVPIRWGFFNRSRGR